MFGVIFKGFQDGKGNYTSISEIMKRNETQQKNNNCNKMKCDICQVVKQYKKCNILCSVRMQFLEKELKRAKQEYEELRQEHNSCCEEFKQEINLRIDAYNKLSRDFWSGKYCNAKFCTQLQAKEQECENQKQRLEYYREKTTQLLDDIDNKDRFNTELQEENEEQKARIKELLHDCNSCKFYQYKQALDEIEKLAKENVELLEGYHLEQANCLTILEIINQAKEV